MDDDDFFGGDERDAQRMIAERELKKLENEFITMGFRQGALEEIENKEKAALNKGLRDGMDITQTIGYMKGKIEFIKNMVARFQKRVDEQTIQNINKKLEFMNNFKKGETSEEQVREYIQQILQLIGQAFQNSTE
ncbi:hypothetical protein TTHERM_00577330 (macronuclear) [Tetrahymena thermophila SB210]|uniref:Essential protein Yae1 N-terminal domain-containing protein n=1 Tax=Tetrahymena thermophila (strain SB210) TaxID=312017 RepID=Q22UX0_TETTS|nr:hypothetical protein TTHERM_00577330 [Tetrahymena thermophila SB210]EAR89178.1 hypothetical protein TTHERM_00577330 [Tetrahymena thermophila SB210]|eukprot:XP_001009423.1 hypothetical protein TTHERM_00577330 [Tetrahymena thermophila SB210]